MTRIKICGITTLEDARFASEKGADLLGFNFYKRSPRYIPPEEAKHICDSLRAECGESCPVLIGVFVNDVVSTVSRITNMVGLDFAQLSGDESDAMLKELRGISYKAIRPPAFQAALDDVEYYRSTFPCDERLPSILLDAYHPDLYGGTGQATSDSIALAVKETVPRMMLAGGLNPENVAARVQAIQPWGVDVASGVEPQDSVGEKDHGKVQAFIDAVRGI